MSESLPDKMRVLAEQDVGIRKEFLRLADNLDEAIVNLNRADRTINCTKMLISCWAKARRRYCEYTGESLI